MRFAVLSLGFADSLTNHERDAMEKILLFFFQPATNRKERWFSALWNAFLYLMGVLHWCLFFNWGRIPYELHDWKQSGSFFSFLREAVWSGQLPLHTDARFVRTERYLAMPNAPFSPQDYLLRFLDIGPFMVVNVVLLFSLGFIGLLLLQRRYALSPLTFGVLFALFNFNGHITAHLAVGHAEWVGYFLLPFLVLLVLKLVEGQGVPEAAGEGGFWARWRHRLVWVFCGGTGWRWSLWLALVFLGLFLQGAFHVALWCAIFLLAFGLTRRDCLPLLLRALLMSVLLSALRIVPAAMQFAGGGVDFVSGFPTVTDLLAALVVLWPPNQAQAWAWKSLGRWEVDSFVGLIGLAFLLWFGVAGTWRKGKPWRDLFVPIVVLVVLSIGHVYRPITLLPLPLVDSERIPARFLIVPLVFLIVLASLGFERWLQARRPLRAGQALYLLAAALLLAHDLFQHSRVWRVVKMYDLFTGQPVDLTSHLVNHPDPPYQTALLTGLILTVLTLMLLIVMAWREGRTRPESPQYRSARSK
jgi:hypothetical protein